MEHILETLSRRYPQLLFPISAGISKSFAYRRAVLLGKEHTGTLDFTMSEKDRFVRIDMPVGTAEALLLYNREDFEKCACALGNRCEPKELPKSVGAFMISGLTNWEKVRSHLAEHGECENNGLIDWERLQSTGCNYKDKIILLSSGYYSSVAPETVGFQEEEWIEKSITIRMYHELAHFVCRTRYPKNTDAIRDEIFADMVGIVAAVGYYDTNMAKIFLGISETAISEEGRIRYYIKDRDERIVRDEAIFWISWLENRIEPTKKENINDLIINIFDKMVSKD